MAKKNLKSGVFITFEGSEGSGKSTQSKLLYDYLKSRGFKVVYLREPGGTAIGEKIRRILLDWRHDSMSAECETLLYMACRAQIVRQIIVPALEKGKIVVCDRFLDSTIAYQGYGLGMHIGTIRYIAKLATGGISPDLTILLDLAAQKGLSKCGSVRDRVERRTLDYHLRVRKGYLRLVARQPQRIKVIKVDDDKRRTQERIRKLVDEFLERCHFKR